MDLPNFLPNSKLKNTVLFLQSMLRVSETTSISIPLRLVTIQ